MSLTDINDDVEDMEELISLKEEWLNMISTYSEDKGLPQLVETVKKALKILPIYEEVVEVEEEVFKIILPIIKDTIYSTCEENESISKSLIHTIQLQTNLQLTINLLESLSEILNYLMNFKQVEASHLQSIPINLGKIIYRTFEYCKTCQKLSEEIIKDTLELFKKTQDVHLKYLTWMDTCLAFNLLEQIDVDVLKEVLDILCHISCVLSGLNWKSVTDNWKGYTALSQKYCELLGVHFNSSLPIKYLTNEINKSLTTVIDIGPENLKNAVQNLKLTGFLIKVALRLFDSYWSFIENCLSDIMDFLNVIYSYPMGYFKHCQFPEEFLDTVKGVVYSTIEPFLIKFIAEPDILKYIINTDPIPENKLGFINLTNNVINCFPNNIDEILINELEINRYIQSIFNCVKDCFFEFYLFDSIFYEEFVSNLATIALRCPQYYSDIEVILISGILQDHIWLTILSIDVWCLILRNCPIITVIETLHGLLSIIEDLDFGLFSPRPEEIFLKTLMNRILSFIPSNYKNELFNKYNCDNGPYIGKFLKMDVTVNPKCLVEDTVSKFLVRSEHFWSFNDLKMTLYVAENLEVISSINFHALNYRNPKLVNTICKFWNFSFSGNLLNNNFFKYFMKKLCKATSAIMEDVNDMNLLRILNQMKNLLSDPYFKLLFLNLIPMEQRYTHEVNKLIRELLKIVIDDRNPIISRTAQIIFNKIFKDQSNIDIELSTPSLEFLKSLENINFNHNCIQWQKNFNIEAGDKCFELFGGKKSLEEIVCRMSEEMPQLKKIRLESGDTIKSETNYQKYRSFKVEPDGDTKKIKSFEGVARGRQSEEEIICINTKDESEITDVINSLKSEVKRLGRVLKNSTPTNKQVSDIKIIIRTLDSYLN